MPVFMWDAHNSLTWFLVRLITIWLLFQTRDRENRSVWVWGIRVCESVVDVARGLCVTTRGRRGGWRNQRRRRTTGWCYKKGATVAVPVPTSTMSSGLRWWHLFSRCRFLVWFVVRRLVLGVGSLVRLHLFFLVLRVVFEHFFCGDFLVSTLWCPHLFLVSLEFKKKKKYAAFWK